jgi:hypothetical protein
MSNSDSPASDQLTALQALQPQLEKGFGLERLFSITISACLGAAGPLLFGHAENTERAIVGYLLLWIGIFGLVIWFDTKQRRLIAVLHRALLELYSSGVDQR